MKKINLLYIVAILLLYILYQMNSKLSNASAFFYGFAENKETELSHDQSVLIDKILVTPGQAVKQGDQLMEVKQSAIELKMDYASLDLERVGIQAQQQRQGLRDRIDQLKIRRSTKIAEINVEVKNLEATIAFNEGLLKDLNSIKGEKITQENNPNAIRLQALKESINLATQPIDVEMAQLQKELNAIQTPSLLQQQKLQSEIEYYKTEQGKLTVIAPSDGIIGNILCKEGENISSFSTLINFYERNPTMVKGFVHESLILKVKEGDSLMVTSTLHPEQTIVGHVIGLGSRIVEIPERLRKIPDFKTYGREILIRIPPTNNFLQKEKVMLNALDEVETNSMAFLLSLFSNAKKKNKKEEKKIQKLMEGK